ncbi:MAG: zinc finger AN1 domain-containing stress-associated protein [Candidatus Lokiarchaeota archaeon]
MARFCEYCGKEIDYLPFSCKYCGGVYCKEHRLPENHECTFELKHTPTIPTNSEKDIRHGIRKYTTATRPREESAKDVRRFLEKERKRRQKERKILQPSFQRINKYPAAIIIPIVIVIISIVSIFIWDIFYSLGPIAFNIYELITGPFVYNFIGFLGFFFFIIIIFFIYMMGRRTELIYGRKFFVILYLVSAYSQLLLFTGLRFALMAIYPITPYSIIPDSLAYSGFIGILCFSVFPAWNTKMRILLCFIPVELKGRTFIIFLSLLSIIPALIYLDVFYLSNLGGILGSYLVYRYKYRFS